MLWIRQMMARFQSIWYNERIENESLSKYNIKMKEEIVMIISSCTFHGILSLFFFSLHAHDTASSTFSVFVRNAWRGGTIRPGRQTGSNIVKWVNIYKETPEHSSSKNKDGQGFPLEEKHTKRLCPFFFSCTRNINNKPLYETLSFSFDLCEIVMIHSVNKTEV